VTFLDFLDRQIGRVVRGLPGWPDGRGLIGLATVSMSVWLLHIYHVDPTLRDDDFFKTIATAVVITGFVNAIVGWAFGDNARSAESTSNTGKFADAVGDLAKKLPTQDVDPSAIRDGDPVTVHKDTPVDSGG